jgi:hypothetical protein
MSIARQYFANLKSGLHLAFFLPTRMEQIHASAPMLLLLFATAVLLHFARDFARVGPGGTLMLFGLPGVLLYVPVLLAAAVAAAWIAKRPADALALATAFAALSLPIIAVELAISALATGANVRIGWPQWIPWTLWQWIFPAWLALATAVATIYLLRLAVRLSSATTIALLIIVALPLGYGYRERTLWMTPYDESAMQERMQYMAAASEDAIYQQPKLLARALDAIEPGRKGVIDLYYVGLGGYASQDVFLREIRSVETMMREQFGARGRAASLLNNPKTVMDTPIASATSLRAVLKRVGEVMNRDEDILFLFMTSHGAKDHKFTLELWPLTFNELTPTVLRAALDEAGILWRVIVVSACYAGGFIDALKDERTIVIAAAGPDKKSFGCSHEADWTYFGKAFFDEALRDQRELTKAFALARAAVEAREKKDQADTHSDPQMAAGKSMEQKWDAYIAQLSGTSAQAKTPVARATKDAVDELVSLWQLPEIASSYRLECMREMANSSPTVYAEKDPNYFGTITRDTPQWPRMVAAWERFADDYCSSTMDAAILHKAYVEAWRQAADETTTRAAFTFLRTREGQKVLAAENRVAVLINAKLAELRRGPADKATARYQQEQVRLNAEAQGADAKSSR